MKKILIAYFSTSGDTKSIALALKRITNGDIFEIVPEVPYTDEDLDWNKETSRSTREMNDPTSRPTIKDRIENISEYDVILLGFPIWWHKAPKIINTFLEKYDFTGKTIIPFSTSGSSPMLEVGDSLTQSIKTATLLEGKRFDVFHTTEMELASWLDSKFEEIK